MRSHDTSVHYAGEIRLTYATLTVTLVAWIAATLDTGDVLQQRWHSGEWAGAFVQVLFIVIVQALIWGNFVYQFTRVGYLHRRRGHQRAREDEYAAFQVSDAPRLAILVPSYKEEEAVVRRTLLSAALQDYPSRRVVLLLDDPPRPSKPAEQAALWGMRDLPRQLQQWMDAAAAPFEQAYAEYLRRSVLGVDLAHEAALAADLYDQAASRLEAMGRDYPIADHADRFFRDVVLNRAASIQRERAAQCRSLHARDRLHAQRIKSEYCRLATLFRVEFASFERKRYVNLSQQANKAMNLNSYIGLLGKRWREISHSDGLHLEPALAAVDATIDVPAADFLITLDADSLLVPEYASLLMHEMCRKGNERLAVVQTPYNSIPGAPGMLERIAGATTDIQYLIHQGFTRYRATYWVGANALLRVSALRDICQVVNERGHAVPVFIQDRTVIEDTESSVDLVARGWELHNYPERLAFSATPPDFGSLLIQRRRWANGGLLILPKLLRHLGAHPHRPRKLAEGFFRAHYLGSIALVNVGLLILLAVGLDQSAQSWWLPLTALPYFLLYARDLRLSGYRKRADLIRVYALNLLLIPINLGGVFKSVHQAITGRRTPFARTPKVSGRTAAPAAYVVAEFALLAFWLVGSAVDAFAGHWVTALCGIANAALLFYAIFVFVGLREGWEDVRLAFAKVGPTLEAPAEMTLSRGRGRAEIAGLVHRSPATRRGGRPATLSVIHAERRARQTVKVAAANDRPHESAAASQRH
jgi:cellulose synthase (UDP-forming)